MSNLRISKHEQNNIPALLDPNPARQCLWDEIEKVKYGKFIRGIPDYVVENKY